MSLGERMAKARNAEKPAWMTEGRWWNSGWISVFGLLVLWIPFTCLAIAERSWLATVISGLFILVSAASIRRALKRKRSGGRF
jgi:hypothetical protein